MMTTESKANNILQNSHVPLAFHDEFHGPWRSSSWYYFDEPYNQYQQPMWIQMQFYCSMNLADSTKSGREHD